MREAGKSATDEGQRGMVLVLVLILLGLAAALIMEGQYAAHRTVRNEEARLRRARLHSALTDAVMQSLQALADDELPEVDHLEEEWAVPRELEYPSGASVLVQVVDENRFFDFNNVYVTGDLQGRRPSDVLMDIMTLCEDFTPIERVQALRDWVDPDDEGFRESSFYMQKETPYEAPNRHMPAWSELLHVAGFSPDYFRRRERYSTSDALSPDLVDTLTVLPGRRSSPVRVNVNTAPREVLLGVAGLEREEWVQYILVLRRERPLASLEPLVAAGDAEMLRDIRPYLDVRSTHYSVRARATEADETVALWALARRTDEGNVKILQWVY